MLISRTPYRISFFGGATDYPVWYQEQGAALLATTINHYCYLHCRLLPAFFQHKSRVVWSQIEEVLDHANIQHPSVRAVLTWLKFNQGIEIHHQGDLPARTGLGSSSAFTVGLLNAIYTLQNKETSKQQIAEEAIYLERDLLNESVGIQDQITTSYGGFNKIEIDTTGHFTVNPVALSQSRLRDFEEHLLLFFTGISRNASNIAAEKIRSIPHKRQELEGLQKHVSQALKILQGDHDLSEVGHLLHESWMLKREICSSVSTPFIDNLYQRACQAGAVGGKLLGAGGGGFLLVFAKPENKEKIKIALSDLLEVPFHFESEGSQIVYNNAAHDENLFLARRDYIHLEKTETG